ncbi:MAG: secondary thiamine-phosphate synthase enzyme YjbQ [Proteobacteria bacterium]|nr:secondary thiamine-phosphate synthase enzyme YjbQ [Pseudomonadota bacterium]MDA1323480.1 secondary thiamine-phosphate synthase enzyme YjbQ [Pseudomonadota bacterium]
MIHRQHSLTFQAPKQGLLEITDEIARWVAHQSITIGLLTLFLRHTSASILIQENADPDVLADLQDFFAALAPEDNSLYRHIAEGPDDMPAHIKGALTQTQLAIPVSQGKMLLGTWQGIYLFEHRRIPRNRELVLHLTGD